MFHMYDGSYLKQNVIKLFMFLIISSIKGGRKAFLVVRRRQSENEVVPALKQRFMTVSSVAKKVH